MTEEKVSWDGVKCNFLIAGLIKFVSILNVLLDDVFAEEAGAVMKAQLSSFSCKANI